MVTPERIGLARRRRSLSVAELARRIDVSAQSVTNYEHGRQQPSARTLHAMAQMLDFPESFFHQPCREEILDGSAAFRARSKLSQRRRSAALASGTLAVDVNGWLEYHFELPSSDVPTLEHPDPETAADMVRARWELGNVPLPNAVHLLESCGVRVFALPREHSDVDAFSFWHLGTPYILLNTAKTPERCRFDAAHELGHLVLHSAARETHGPVAEHEANMFAAALLMPAVSIRGYMPQAALLDDVLRGKLNWGVSALALTYRLHELSLLNDWQYRTMCVELSRRGYRKSEYRGVSPETSQLLDKVLTTLRRTGHSMSDIATELHLSADELSSMLLGLVVAPVTNSGAGYRPEHGGARQESTPRVLTLV